MTAIGQYSYSEVQVGVAQQIYNYVEPRWSELIAIAAVANGDRECSLNPKLRGDGDSAGGLWQWHADRRNAILASTKADVWDGSVQSALTGFQFEVGSNKTYMLALARMKAASTPEDASEAWCRYYDVAGAADAIERSRTLATAWAAYFNVA